MKSFALLVVFLFSGAVVCFSGEPQARSVSVRGNFSVSADSLAIADEAVQRATIVFDRFLTRLKFSGQHGKVPITGVLGSSEPSLEGNSGWIRVFSRSPGCKIQIDWGKGMLSPESYRRTWVRAFCMRQALISSGLGEGDENQVVSGMPFWLTDGIGALLEEPMVVQNILNRITLLAKTEPDLSLDDFCYEVLAKPERDASRRAMIAGVCARLLSSEAGRGRFLQNLVLPAETSIRTWLQGIVAPKDVDQWWNEFWMEQRGQFSVLRLSSVFSEREFLRAANVPVSGGENSVLQGILHPWYSTYLESRFPGESRDKMTPQDRADLVSLIHLHRTASLEWMNGFDEIQMTRQELLEWGCEHPRGEASGEGAVRRWFETLVR